MVIVLNFIRKVANSDILTHIIDLPENLKHKQVEIIVLPVDENEMKTGSAAKSAKGFLSKYKNPSLVNEEGEAWGKAMVEKYEHS